MWGGSSPTGAFGNYAQLMSFGCGDAIVQIETGVAGGSSGNSVNYVAVRIKWRSDAWTPWRQFSLS